MELHTSSRMIRGYEPIEVCAHYLDRLSPERELNLQLLRRVDRNNPAKLHAAFAELHQAIAGRGTTMGSPALASAYRRLEIAYGKDIAEDERIVRRGDRFGTRLVMTPPIRRTPMAPGPWPPNPGMFLASLLKKLFNLRRRERPVPSSPRHWSQVGKLRRLMLVLLVVAQTTLATLYMREVLPYHGQRPLEVAELIMFALLCAWISAGFWTAIMGYFVLRLGGDRHAISGASAGNAPIPPEARTAIVMPICNEHVKRVFAGLQATYESLSRSGELEQFDFFVLSDSSNPDCRVAETEAWLQLCRTVGGFGRIFYRWRKHRIKRKSGNIADFCRRWGSTYRYMVILDADSVMTGDCLTRLVRLMEQNASAGIIQTAPHASGRDTLYARLQQFASRVYGPLFTAGLHYWQLGESHYWGHNAIIRVAPFMQHCALGRLPGKGALSGEILSHDFVEAALMRRAGWGVWIAYDLPGSYEEMPPNLVDELKRDRRWCHGNLMNFRLFFAPGIHPVHRAVFVTGMFSYVSAPLWLAFLLLSTWMLAQHTLVEPEYFVEPEQLFPVWPEWHPERALALFGVTAIWLFLPKLLSVSLIRANGAREFGGTVRLILSMLAEFLFSMLLAPIRMLFHSQFVAAALSGWSIQWQSPPREEASTPWSEAVRRHGWHTALGLVWGGLVYWLNPAFFLWLTPIVGAMVLSIPISYYSSQAFLGRIGRKAGFFVIPEEMNPPRELRELQQNLERAPQLHGFYEAVTDPAVNALMCAAAPKSMVQPPLILKRRRQLLENALSDGPAKLHNQQKMALLNDPAALSQLHFEVWASSALHPAWQMS